MDVSDHEGLLRARDEGEQQVTPLELFFDLVFVFAVTQLSHSLLEHLTTGGALGTLLLLVAVWRAWVDTIWVTNWFDPNRTPVRLLLIALMLTLGSWVERSRSRAGAPTESKDTPARSVYLRLGTLCTRGGC